jgi:hypothetical protein
MLSSEEIHCENHFKANTGRDLDGRFIIKLPIKNEKLDIGESKNLALKRFYNTERKFAKNPEKTGIFKIHSRVSAMKAHAIS